ncbi:MAG: prepilin-type N-terminal cleavage/methylation domain-containing protein [Rhodocyclaceae bacterium]|nr:prepilin-type N-terminal cleavage/methylation domain-containing protein [Rhodocyclaceae bacterium]
MKSQQSGFTLVEIAIVLVIIGLLLGGVLKGQELINSAKVKNFANDFRNIPLFIYGYQDKYRALPGDDAAAAAHVGAGATQIAAANGSGNGTLNGNWWDGAASLANSETVAFWEHIRRANLAAGATAIASDADLPKNAEGGWIGIEAGSTVAANQYITGLSGTYIVCSAGILGKFAKQLDSTMDDGNPYTGSMRAVPGMPNARGNAAHCAVAGTPAACATAVDDAAPYTVCLAF